jgi:CDP-diacylglycerol---glycerol-3-phosphate 3-phosphatidyltransferase
MSRQAFALLNLALIVGAATVGMRAFRRSAPDLGGIKGSKMLSPNVRAWYLSNLQPFEDLFVSRGVLPAVLSVSQLVSSFAAGFAYAWGLIYTAGFLVLFTGTLDILDGKVARRTNGGSPRGAFLDSVIDRYAEFVTLTGLLVFFASGWPVWGVILAMLGGMMVSYTRARAEGLGQRCEIGLLQRPERFVLLGFGSIASSIAVHAFRIPGDHLLILTVWLVAVVSNVTALQRAVYVLHQLDGGGHG